MKATRIANFDDRSDVQGRLLRTSSDPHFPRSRLFVLENTHNMAGGRVLDPAGVDELAAAAHDAGLLVHVDGARLANAAVACGVPPASLTRSVDTVSLCLSKGLGAPVGSLLAGSEDFIRSARRARKAFGGGMRQAGVIAAAGLLALTEGPARLADDHRRAGEIAAVADGLPGLSAAAPDPNIVMVDVAPPVPAAALVDHLRDRGVLALAVGPSRVRFVTHRDLDDTAVERCVAALTEWARR